MDRLNREKLIFGSIFLLANKLQAIGDQFLSGGGVTTKQWFLSVVISQFRDHSPSLSEVADLLGSSRQNVKQLALKLEERGMLRIEKDEQDARTLRLVLTEKNREFWKLRRDKDNGFIRDLFRELSDEELAGMAEGIGKLTGKLESWGNQYQPSEVEE